MRRCIPVLGLGLALFLVAARPALAGWSVPQTVLQGVPASSVFTDGGGAHVAASTWNGRSAALVVRDVAADGRLGAERTVLRSSLDDRYSGDSGFVADGSGVVLARRVRKPYPRVRASFFAADGTITPLRTISSPGHTARLQFDNLAVSANGRALATWLQYEGRGGGWHIEGAFREPGTNAFGAPVRISPALSRRDVVITTDLGTRGDAVVTWRDNGRAGSAYAALARPGQAFSAPQTLGPTGFGLHVVIGADGRVVIAESVLPRERFGVRFELRVWRLAADGVAFGPPATVTDTCDCGEAENFDLALSPGGHVAIVWGDATFTSKPGGERTYHFVLDVYEAAFGAGLKRTAQLAAGGGGHSGARIATDDAGDVLVGWGERAASGTGSRYVLSLKSAGGAFDIPVDVGWDGRTSGDSASTAALAVRGPRQAVVLIDAFGSGAAPGDGSGHRVLVTRLTP